MIEHTLFIVALGTFIVMIVYTLHAGMDYQRWAWSVRYWRDRRRVRAIQKKKFKSSPTSYGYEKLNEDDFGVVWELPEHVLAQLRTFGWNRGWTNTVLSRQRIVEVTDPSTLHKHYLAVPMIEQTSFGKGAVAWTFELEPDQYQPNVET